MRALLSALALVHLAPNIIAYSSDLQPTSTIPDQALDMPIVAFTTLTMPESSAQPVSYDDNTVLVAFDGQADDIPAEEESLSLPLNLVNERIRKKMDRDVFKFKNINMQLSDLPETQPESVEGDSSLIPGEQLFETETSSAPRVLSINIVLPTFAIRITEDPGVSDIETVLSIASFINNPEETTRAPVSPIFDAPDVTQENQRASGMLAKPVETPVISSRFPDRNFASVSAVQRHEITLDEMELLSILHMQSIVPMVASTAPPAGFYGAPMHTPPVVQGISSAPAPLNAPSFYPPPPMPRPVSSAVEPSRSWPTPRHRSKNGQRLNPVSPGKPHRNVFTGLPPDAIAPGAIEGPAEFRAGVVEPVSVPPVIVTQNVYVPDVPSPSLSVSSPPVRQYSTPSHPAQQDIPPAVLHDAQTRMITVLLRPTHQAPPENEPQRLLSAAPTIFLPPPSETPITPPPPPPPPSPPSPPPLPPMLVDSISQQNTPIIPFISNGSRLPIPTPQDDDAPLPLPEAKGEMNASGLASLLENVLHIPANAITINGKPISENSNVGVGKNGPGNIVIVGGKGVGVFGNRNSSGDDDGDDDDMDSDWDNESTTTHMLDVDRARNHRRIGAKTLNFDNDSSSSRSTNSNDGGDDSSSDDEDDDSDTVSDSDDDSDSNDTVESSRTSTSNSPSSSASHSTATTTTMAESATLTPATTESPKPKSTENATKSSSTSSLNGNSTSSSSSSSPPEPQSTSSSATSSESASSSADAAESARSLLNLVRILAS